MRVGVVLENNDGLEGYVCEHFGQCAFFLIADIDEKLKKINETRIVKNNSVHGGGGCKAVDEILQYNITHVIAGGMGGGAQQKFNNACVKIFGYEGKVKDALNDFMNNALGGLSACESHGHHENCH